MSKKKIVGIVLIVLCLAAVLVGVVLQSAGSGKADEMPQAELEALVNEQFDTMADAKTEVVQYIAKNNTITVQNVTYGENKDIVLDCTVETIDVYNAVSPHYNQFLASKGVKANGMAKTRDVLKNEFAPEILALLENAEPKTEAVQITVYQTEHNGYVVHAEEAVVDTVYGGAPSVQAEASAATEYTDASGQTQKVASTNVSRGLGLCFALNYSADKPDTSTYWGRVWNGFANDFHRNFIEYDRWFTIVQGLGMTLALTFMALLLGIVLGFLVAFVRCTYLKTAKPKFFLRLLNGISQIYLTVIRGTPVVVQVMIIYFVIFMPLGMNKFLAAVICFGLNSGAYVAEIVRGGIMSVDEGQTEAGRSLGFGYFQTMWYVVFPQAFKAVLPALANEFIVLLKETSVAFCIGLGDLMYAGNAIRAATYTAFMPLVTVAIVYLIMVMGFSKLVGILERRLRKNER